MCERLVNLDTVARVLADYYHLKTDAQLAALDEALSRVPDVSVGGSHGKDHIADPGKMVGDLISRQAAIDATWFEPSYTDPLNVLTEVRDRLKALPSAQQWISCEERLPEESGRYLISVLDGVGRRTTVALYQPRYKAWTMTGRMAYWKVIAWMPLPEPWKGEQE